MSILVDGLKELKIEYTDDQISLINEYIDEVMLFNPKYGLVNATGDTFVIKHILDSLAGVNPIKEIDPKSIADVGSGGGFPGIPLAIFFPDVEFHLIERSGKRCNFLRNAVLTLGLKNVHIRESAVEQIKEKFDLVTFRAFTPMEVPITTCLLGLLNETGLIFAYKGREGTIAKELKVIDELIKSSQIISIKVPFLPDERNFLILQ
ncbi:MAG: 16S rRNA (guanine(527)-N(7))-methyltransferase RsmG [Spirochaetaceae bacterium 4572_7]|nr:MAG: 16S rRNA (guanine(527)-N(7))-methyltransferase RsmG [Spirochaetaceae bacterium 4572_7]